jgi:hypothetical protein
MLDTPKRANTAKTVFISILPFEFDTFCSKRDKAAQAHRTPNVSLKDKTQEKALWQNPCQRVRGAIPQRGGGDCSKKKELSRLLRIWHHTDRPV